MYLARIEMTGFKSFADKTVIEFDKGMTAVVGPNGSGKSNLSEAIRWVLGEQSAKSLRGAKMEDVIFNGTQDRKAVNLAKVTLVLNNEDRYLDYDYSEISITRSYNRNGESNYYINNESVRLKDIVDLLLDSGLGKNSFAMISQGKVESIFLNKPEERRSIFEEAAGVQKYQYRKIEAERKLNKSSDHLSRVKDIIHELEGQLKPLKKQREKAIQYQEYQEVLSRLEVSMYTYQIEQNRQKWEKAKADLSLTQNDILNGEQQTEQVNTTINQSQEQLEQLIDTIDQENQHYQELVRQLEQAKAKHQMANQELQFNQSNSNEKAQQYEHQLNQREQLQNEQLALNTSILESKQHLDEIKTSYQQLIKQRQIAEGLSDEAIENLRSQMIEYYQQEASANNEIQQMTQQLSLFDTRSLRLQERANQVIASLQSTQEQIQQYTNDIDESKQHQSIQHHTHQQLTGEWQSLQQRRETIQKQLFDSERQLNNQTYRLQALKQMQEQYDGYYGGVKAIMKNADQIGGIDGTVAELIQVREAYQIAIDTALGGALQHIVVKDDAAARRAIQLLKEKRAGRATFLPRPNIKERSIAPHLLNTANKHNGFVGIASDLVDYKESDANIIKNLLGMTIIMDSTEHAQQLARQLQFQVRIVTLDGDLLMPGGSISGGRQKQQGNSMLSRQTEIESLTEAIKEARLNYQQLEQALTALTEEETNLRQKGEASREAVNAIDHKVQQMQQTLSQLQTQLTQQENDQKIIHLEQRDLDDERTQAKERLIHAQDLSKQMQEKIAEGNLNLEQINTSQADRQEKLAAVTEQINQLSTEQALKQQALSQQQQQLTMIEAQLHQIESIIEHHAMNQQSEAISLEQLQAVIDDMTERIDQLTVEQTNKTQLIESKRQERSKLNHTLREFEETQRNLQANLQKHYQIEAKLQAQIEKYDELIDNHLNYLNENYQLSYEAAVAQAQNVESISDVTKQVKDLRRSIDALGPINLAAIEDYDSLNERYGYLIEQQDDLLTAMSQLQETMDEMDEEVIKRFSEAFNQINHQFKRTFKRLFGGGEASLELTDPDDLLTTGVDIIAQPPGKRKQNLALLSGGERAFTAIALLFAILETKPVPFCVLDEVEAALDDANVWRYGEYLQHFTSNTQFIVITHRKGTMEHADVLYGVTMERSGVSKLASVRLSEAKV